METLQEQAQPSEMRGEFYRLTGRAGIAGGILAIVSNALHPRQGPTVLGSDRSTEDFLDMIAGYSLWRLDHLLIVASLLLGVVALIGLGRSLVEEGRSPWAQLCLPLAAAAGAVGAVSFALDGYAMGGLGEEWGSAAGEARAELLERAASVVLVDTALFSITIITLFGALQLVYGLALLRSEQYPRWTGGLAVAGGLIGFASGTVQWMAGELNVLGFLILFSVTSVLFSGWLLGTSLYLTRRS